MPEPSYALGLAAIVIYFLLERGVLRAIQVPGGKRLVQAASLERLVSGTVK